MNVAAGQTKNFSPSDEERPSNTAEDDPSQTVTENLEEISDERIAQTRNIGTAQPWIDGNGKSVY